MRGHDTYSPLFPFTHFTKLAFIRRPTLNEDHELLHLLIFYLYLRIAIRFAIS